MSKSGTVTPPMRGKVQSVQGTEQKQVNHCEMRLLREELRTEGLWSNLCTDALWCSLPDNRMLILHKDGTWRVFNG